MNIIFIILVALGFTAGVLFTTYDAVPEKEQHVTIEKDKKECCAEDDTVLKQETNPQTLFFTIN